VYPCSGQGDKSRYIGSPSDAGAYEYANTYQELQSVEKITLNSEHSESKNSLGGVKVIFDPKFKFLKENIIRIIKKKEIDLSPFSIRSFFQRHVLHLFRLVKHWSKMEVRTVFHHMRLPAMRDEYDV
jgi:hypothetical protein